MISSNASVPRMVACLAAAALYSLSAAALAQTSVFINEIHYDNTGTDTGEAIEIAGPAGASVDGWSVVRYNGNGGAVYGSDTLSGTIPDSGNGFGFVVIDYPANGLQNGSPDGVALVDAGGTVIQFLSYEGSFTAVDGPAAGLVSTDIGVSELSSTEVGFSLQLVGTGSTAEDFAWAGPQGNTFGAVNTGQVFQGGVVAPAIVINEFLADPAPDLSGDANGDGVRDGSEDEFVEIVNTSAAALDISGWTLSDAVGVRHVFPAGTVLSAQCGIVVFGGGTPAGAFGGMIVQTASTGFIGLNNTGDSIFLSDGTATVADASFASGEGVDQSRTRDPDLTGGFVDHSLATTSGGALLSPGTRADGSLFAGCEAPPAVVTIPEVQGDGAASPLTGEVVTVAGIVTGDFQDAAGGDGDLNGFFLQDETGDGNDATSDGIFVFDGFAPAVDVVPGDRVRVTGTVAEFFGETQIDATGADAAVEILSSGSPVPLVDIALPSAAVVTNSLGESIADLERYEGMHVRLPQRLVVTELFQLDRFGEVTLAEGDRFVQFTQASAPDATGYAAHLVNIASRSLILDDGLTLQNPDPIRYPAPGLDSANTLRMGDEVFNLTGNIRYSRGSGGAGDEAFRLEPTEEPLFVATNARPGLQPDVGSGLRIASVNLLNFFNDLDDGTGQCFPSFTDNDCRGADSVAEFERQLEKTVSALSGLDADIIGVVELENDYPDGADSSIATLVDAMNAAAASSCGSDYAYVDPPGSGRVGEDVIAVGIIYCAATVTPAAGTGIEILEDADLAALGLSGPIFSGPALNRAPLAATFEEAATGDRVTVAVNHFKSKGSSGLPGIGAACASDPASEPDCDQQDGVEYWNARRTEAAVALAAWLATDPTASGDDDIVILGDLNAYLQEDPILTLEASGYTNLVRGIPGAYSFVFDGQSGTLDYAMVSASLAAAVTGAVEWHINADEPDGLDYNLDFGRNPAIFDGAIPARAADHDPILVGLALQDRLAPEIACNAPSSVDSDELSLEFTASAFDGVDGDVAVEILGARCKAGRTRDRSSSCDVAVDGDTLTVTRSGDFPAKANWAVRATDDAGNVAEAVCLVTIL